MQLVTPNELNTYDVLVNDWLVFSKATLEESVARFGGTASAEADAVNAGSDATGDQS